jgi:hypothetical protein
MLKTLTFALVLGAASALPVTVAGAMPVVPGLQTATDEVTLVREGCGPGRQYSQRLRRCVEDTPRAKARDLTREIRRDLRDLRECGPGRHWSRRLQRCVRN